MPLTPIQRRVCDRLAARRDALLADLRLHVETPTGGGQVAGLDRTRTLLTDRARRLGASIELKSGEPRPAWLWGSPGYGAPSAGAGSCGAVQATPQPPPSGGGSECIAVCRREQVAGGLSPVLIAGHLDTVHDPHGPFQKLAIAPDGRTATGPGCVDMKGGLVIALAALEGLDECGVRLPWTLLLNSDEETGSYHSQDAIFSEAARVARAGGLGVALEPAGAKGELIVERAGSGQFFLEVRGRAAHVGREFRSGLSAVNALARLVVQIAELSRPDDDVIVNIGPVEGGSATNVVPDRARAWGNVRFPTREAARTLEADLRTLAATAVRSTPGLVVEISTSFIREAKPLTVGTRRLADTARAASESLGRDLPFGRTAGVCDGNIMQAAGLATLDTLGVRGGGLHTPEEWIELDSLVERCQLLAVFLMRASEQSADRG